MVFIFTRVCLTLVVEWCVLVEFCVGTATAAADAPAAHAQGAQQHGVEDLGPEDGEAADHDGQDEDRLGRAELGHVGALRVSLSARCPRPKTRSLSLTLLRLPHSIAERDAARTVPTIDMAPPTG